VETFGFDELQQAWSALDRHLAARGTKVELFVVGGAALVAGYGARRTTRDVDAVVLPPEAVALVRDVARVLADELGWPSDWLNDAAKAYVKDPLPGESLFEGKALAVRIPVTEQLLAMKLSAWRDDVDVADARLLLGRCAASGREELWQNILRHVLPGRELKARYALDDLWDSVHGTA
jgi:hypothetical protein